MNANFANPTPITVGMNCTFDGVQYQVSGRVVLGMEEDGETYYWNEYNLQADNGDSCTLVYEETEHGGDWKIFTYFEPSQPLTAAQASLQRNGFIFDVDGQRYRITLVDESRVYHIEGAAPEGVEIGDVAHYFNAGTAGDTVVVSWTGNEVEYFRGRNVSTSDVAVAFGISLNRIEYDLSRSSSSNPAQGIFQILGILAGGFFFVFVVIMVFGLGRSTTHPNYTYVTSSSPAQPPTPAPPPPPPPPPPLMLAATGMLDGVAWTVQTHTVAQMAVVGRYYNRHEYQLVNNSDKSVLMVCDSRASATNWTLYCPVTLKTPVSPEEAGAIGLGGKIELEEGAATVTRLFRNNVLEAEALESVGNTVKTVYYGLEAQIDETPCMVRWNTNGIMCYLGKIVAASEVKKAFEGKSAVSQSPGDK